MLKSNLLAYLLVSSSAVFAAESYKENPGSEGNGSFTAGPEYKVDPDDGRNMERGHGRYPRTHAEGSATVELPKIA